MIETVSLITPSIDVYKTFRTSTRGPEGKIPLTEKMLVNEPSGNIFALSQNAGMGWEPSTTDQDNFLIFSTQGGLPDATGNPVALGLHIGHWELRKVIEEAASEFKKLDCIPFATFASDPCDGRTQGTPGMRHSLPSRDILAMLFLHQIASLPTRKGIMAVATCDKGLPAAMMALAASGEFPGILVPGGVTLSTENHEDTGLIQTVGARFSHSLITLDHAQEHGCHTCASPGGGCQFLGTAATSQVVGEALGLSLPHSALAPSGSEFWLDLGRRSARALRNLQNKGITIKDILTDGAIKNAMYVHAAFGGSTNLLLHLPAIANMAGLIIPKVEDWANVNCRTPRLVDVLPNGPFGYPTVRVFAAGGVPEVMLHLRDLDLLDLDALTVSGMTLDEVLKWWESSEHRKTMRNFLFEREGINPYDVIMTPTSAIERGLTSTVTFISGNLAPEGAVIKSTAIDKSVLDESGVYKKTGMVKVFSKEDDAIRALKTGGIKVGDIMILIGMGPKASGMPEVYQITSSLKHLAFGKHVALLTDGRFSGVSTGACIGHISPEAKIGGPIGKLKDNDVVEIIVDCKKLRGTVNLIGHGDRVYDSSWGEQELKKRELHPGLKDLPCLPRVVKQWTELQSGTWNGCTTF